MNNRNVTEIQTPEALLHDLRALVTEAEKIMSGPNAHDTDVGSNLRARYDAAQERFAELYSTAKTKVAAGAKCTDAAIRANPYQSLAIALGAGLLVGVLVGRSTK